MLMSNQKKNIFVWRQNNLICEGHVRVRCGLIFHSVPRYKGYKHNGKVEQLKH